jgi:lipoprotein NlpI
MRMRQPARLGLEVMLTLVAATVACGQEAHPISPEARATLQQELTERIDSLARRIAAAPDDVPLRSQRGDAYFFRGDFAEAVADYAKMVELDSQQDASHWRKGIAHFYAKEYERAAGQFERYHSFDNVDRENGIWRYLSQVKAHGKVRAREGLLKYEKDDREPFPDVYKLFAGEIAPEEILERIEAAKIGDAEREKRRFYAHLYIGLNHAVENEPRKASQHLREAVRNTWAPTAGYGPAYMWQVGRLHYELLAEQPGAVGT